VYEASEKTKKYVLLKNAKLAWERTFENEHCPHTLHADEVS